MSRIGRAPGTRFWPLGEGANPGLSRTAGEAKFGLYGSPRFARRTLKGHSEASEGQENSGLWTASHLTHGPGNTPSYSPRVGAR